MVKILIAATVILVVATVGVGFYKGSKKIDRLTLEVSTLSAELRREKERNAEDTGATGCKELSARNEARQVNDGPAVFSAPTQVTAPAPKETPNQDKSREESRMEAVVRTHLKDPDSAKFGKLVVIDSKMACLPVNARNSYGGYTGERYFVMKPANDDAGWVIDPEVTQGEFGDNLCRLSLVTRATPPVN